MTCLFMKVYIRKGIYIARNLSPNLQLKTHRKKNSCCKCHHQPPHHQSHVCFSSIRSSPNLGSWRLKCWKIETWEVRGFDRFAICQIYKSNQPKKIKRFKKRHQLPNEQLVSSFGNLDFLSTHLLSSAKLTASLGSPTARLGGAQAWRSSDKKMEEIGFLEDNVFFFQKSTAFFSGNPPMTRSASTLQAGAAWHALPEFSSTQLLVQDTWHQLKTCGIILCHPLHEKKISKFAWLLKIHHQLHFGGIPDHYRGKCHHT